MLGLYSMLNILHAFLPKQFRTSYLPSALLPDAAVGGDYLGSSSTNIPSALLQLAEVVARRQNFNCTRHPARVSAAAFALIEDSTAGVTVCDARFSTSTNTPAGQ